MRSSRDEIKKEFSYYLANVARSARRTSEGFNLGRTAVGSFLSFIEVDKLFDYAPEKWSHIQSIYDITDPVEVKQIADLLLNDGAFLQHDSENNQGWRSGAISHYTCFINARSYFLRLQEVSNIQEEKRVTNKSLQQIFYGAPGAGKSNTIKREVDDKGKTNFRITFHPDSDYSTFVGCYKPIMKENVISKNGVETKEEQIVYRFVPQAFTKAYTTAWNTIDEVYLIIEEINRGNCAQIFGDLFQLLDRKSGFSEYPIDADSDLGDYICEELKGSTRTDFPEGVKEGKKLVLPENLYIWATMNTSDQSLFPIDSAFKRRWDWKYMKIRNHPEENYKIKLSDKEYDWWEFIQRINEIIASMTSSADKQLGYFFCKATEGNNISPETFVSKVIFYLWNDVFKDYGFEDESLFSYKEVVEGKEERKELTFPDFYDEDGEKVNEVRLKGFLDSVMNWKKDEESK